jgi:hypothetical protein
MGSDAGNDHVAAFMNAFIVFSLRADRAARLLWLGCHV